MGYLNSPATCQDRIVNEVLRGLHRKTLRELDRRPVGVCRY